MPLFVMMEGASGGCVDYRSAATMFHVKRACCVGVPMGTGPRDLWSWRERQIEPTVLQSPACAAVRGPGENARSSPRCCSHRHAPQSGVLRQEAGRGPSEGVVSSPQYGALGLRAATRSR